MPFSELTSKQFVISLPDQDGKPGIEIARILASENNPKLLLKFSNQITFKDLRNGIPLLPIHAKFIGEGLQRAAELSEKAFPGST